MIYFLYIPKKPCLYLPFYESGDILFSSPFPYRVQYLWRTRLLLFCFPIALLDGFFYFLHPALFWVIFALWAVLFLTLYGLYFPMLYRSLNYQITSRHIRLRQGALFRRENMIYMENIQYLTLSQTPLQRLFGLATLHITAAGGSLRLAGLEEDTVQTIRWEIASRMEQISHGE